MEPTRQVAFSEDVHGAEERPAEEPRILEEIEIEELAIDGICGVY